MNMTETNRDGPQMTAELRLALSVQEFVKNYLENSVTTVLAFIVRAPLAVWDPWSLSEPHPCLRVGKLGQNTTSAIFEAP